MQEPEVRDREGVSEGQIRVSPYWYGLVACSSFVF